MEASMVEIAVKPDNRPLLPPNYVSLRQLREQRLKEKQEKEKEKEKVKESDNYVSLSQLREQRLFEDKEKGKGKGEEKGNETDNCVPPNHVSLRRLQEWRLKEKKEKENGREEESGNRPRLPPNYVSLKQLQEQQLKEEKESEKEKEKEDDKVREKMKEIAIKKGEERGEKDSLLPPNYISLRQLRELRLQEKEEAPKARSEQTKVQREGDESGQIEADINKKACNMARNHQSNCTCGCVKSSWVWEPVHPPAGASSSIGISSVDSVFQPENGGVSHEVVMTLYDQNEDAEMKLRKKKKKKKKGKKHGRKMFSGKVKGEPVQGSELLTEVTDLKIGKAVDASSNTIKEVTIYQNENNAVQKGKGENVNLTESSSLTIPVLVQKERFNGVQMGYKMHNRRYKGKGKTVILSEKNHNVVVPLSKVAKGSDGVEEAIGSKIENVEQKGKGKMINIPELSDRTPCHEEEKGILGAGEVIRSEIWNGEEKGMGKCKFNGVQMGYKMRNRRDKGKGKEVILSEKNHNVVVPLSKVAKGSDGVEEVIGSKIENVEQKGKGKMINIPELSDQTPCHEEAKGILGAGEVIRSEIWKSEEKGMGKCKFNGVQMGYKMRNRRDKGKGKQVILSEKKHNVVVPLSKAAKGSHGVEEVIGSKIDNFEQKGKGKMINIPELSDQTPCHEEAKGILGAGEVIRSEIWNGKEKGMSKNVNLPESNEWGGQIGGNRRKRNQAAGIRGRGYPRAGGFAVRPAEHLRGGVNLVWVPKKSS